MTANLLECKGLSKLSDQLQVTQGINDEIAQANGMETWMLRYDQIINFGDVWADITTGQAKTAGHPQLHFAYHGIVCTSIIPKRSSQNPMVWETQITYAGQFINSPAPFWNVQLNQASDKQERPATQDRTGAFLQNVNGETIPQLPNTKDYLSAYTLTFQSTGNTTVTGWGNFTKAKGQVNSDVIGNITICGLTLNYQPRQMLLEDAVCRATRLAYTDPVSLVTTYQIMYDYSLSLLCWEGNTTGSPIGNNTWQFRTVNTGWKRKDTTGKMTGWERPPGATDDANPQNVRNMPAAPFMLAADGTALNPDGIAPPTSVTPLWLPDALNSSSPPAGAFQLERQDFAFSPMLTPFKDP
jgi:hypothetical protein